jgi:hypothetical protein
MTRRLPGLDLGGLIARFRGKTDKELGALADELLSHPISDAGRDALLNDMAHAAEVDAAERGACRYCGAPLADEDPPGAICRRCGLDRNNAAIRAKRGAKGMVRGPYRRRQP